jgi:hypothetical protein
LNTRLNAKLQLPKSNTNVADSKVDSTVFFTDLGFEGYDALRPMIQRAWSSTVQLSPKLQILHWATEYKINGASEGEVQRQTMMAMATGLNQRRALGFLDHFVFGTAHLGKSLQVFAGTWGLKQVQPPTQESGGAPQDPGVVKKQELVGGATTGEKGKTAEVGEPTIKRRKTSKSGNIKVDQEQTTNQDPYEVSLDFHVLVLILTLLKI